MSLSPGYLQLTPEDKAQISKRFLWMPDKDAVAEAIALANEAKTRGVTLRLLGGIAFRLRCPSSMEENLKRNYVDIDFVGLRKQRKEIQDIFIKGGYSPRTTFNAMNGYKRLIFNDIENERRVDIFLNEFEMCHKLDFTDRLKLDELTLPLSDLLLTKLQVYEITEREYRDVIAFFKDQKLGAVDSADTFNAKHIAELCAADWGLYRTVSLNLGRILEALPNYVASEEQSQVVRSKVEGLIKVIESEGKSFGWKMRAKIGDKVKWYELPEADKEVVDSRPSDERRPSAN